jgi:hypothetical protein
MKKAKKTKKPQGQTVTPQEAEDLVNALEIFVQDTDCTGQYDDDTREEGEDCTCARCHAEEVLKKRKSWRFRGALAERRRTNPRERKIMEAWEKFCGDHGDHILKQVFRESADPSARDWFVVASFLQWLGTNVGMSILEAAGFRYRDFDEDRKEQELQAAFFKLRERVLPLSPPKYCKTCHDHLVEISDTLSICIQCAQRRAQELRERELEAKRREEARLKEELERKNSVTLVQAS